MRVIMGIEIEQRENDAKKVQEILTEYGCSIKTRLGLHEAGNMCSSKGLLILEFCPDQEAKIAELEKQLGVLEGVKVKKMEF